MDVANLRKDYVRHGLLESEAPTDPFDLFRTWFETAVDAGLEDPNAMTLATATTDGAPRARIVLLKGFDERGFCFFTNYASSKARELDANPSAALVFYWHDLERQVRIEGATERTSTAESDAYFEMRPRDSRIGAHASPQSRELASRDELEARLAAEQKRFGESGDVPRPDDWGGYRLIPSLIEFWQGRPARLHDRLAYRREGGSTWTRARLAP
ncbi:Pyridoxine/pyridoxamine 5'-phosphate oxidase [Planctomycetes bacterium Pla163]|uniref:Pyridoxine/pyridoxamine 5'-phosphate oxidase n=1 Tax=Rohdeia mirabilis TaxID=2528008 RepID=A0A518CYM6_9BACT|nr:Pyridoxine/pyridoxamine 5'-phosphate oxidase [Planctomycetes bacterium Pla163]